ncbi:MAG TPA: hypothetical protein VIK18_25105 [Pirellulales bacterium]
MKMDNLALRTATTFVNSYTREDELIEKHAQAMKCRDCEAFLQLGIDAFNWIIRADQITRQAIYEGTAEFDHPSIENAVRQLCHAWLRPCGRAEAWVAVQHSRNFRVDNLEAFRACCKEMQAIVKAQELGDGEELPPVLIDLCSKAIAEHVNGQTAEFI